MKYLILIALLPLTTQLRQYRLQSSGYGDNNSDNVQNAAGASPQNSPVDYTSRTADGSPDRVAPEIPSEAADFDVARPFTFPKGAVIPGGSGTNIIGNVDAQALGMGGAGGSAHYTSVYAAILIPNHNSNGNNNNARTLGKISAQGQQNDQTGGNQAGAETNQGGAIGDPSQDVPIYAVLLIPNENFNDQTLGQVNGQGQVQEGGEQTAAGNNVNLPNAGQTNNKAGDHNNVGANVNAANVGDDKHNVGDQKQSDSGTAYHKRS